MAVGIAFIRGLTGRPLGNFYVDLVRGITRVLLPISIVGAIALIIAGVPETLSGPVIVPTLEYPTINQAIARDPVAHFEIIKELGENGGGFFAINSAHPFENPNGFFNLLQLVAILSVLTSLIYTYDIYANSIKQKWLVYSIPFAILVGFVIATVIAGLMVGRTPEFLGRKIEKREVVLASFLILLVHPIAILIPGAIALASPDLQGISNPGFHGLSQVIYCYRRISSRLETAWNRHHEFGDRRNSDHLR